jgi:hypothetical protein
MASEGNVSQTVLNGGTPSMMARIQSRLASRSQFSGTPVVETNSGTRSSGQYEAKMQSSVTTPSIQPLESKVVKENPNGLSSALAELARSHECQTSEIERQVSSQPIKP